MKKVFFGTLASVLLTGAVFADGGKGKKTPKADKCDKAKCPSECDKSKCVDIACCH